MKISDSVCRMIMETSTSRPQYRLIDIQSSKQLNNVKPGTTCIIKKGMQK
jgi:hypothetical protein